MNPKNRANKPKHAKQLKNIAENADYSEIFPTKDSLSHILMLVEAFAEVIDDLEPLYKKAEQLIQKLDNFISCEEKHLNHLKNNVSKTSIYPKTLESGTKEFQTKIKTYNQQKTRLYKQLLSTADNFRDSQDIQEQKEKIESRKMLMEKELQSAEYLLLQYEMLQNKGGR